MFGTIHLVCRSCGRDFDTECGFDSEALKVAESDLKMKITCTGCGHSDTYEKPDWRWAPR